jgi:hypothetical protein
MREYGGVQLMLLLNYGFSTMPKGEEPNVVTFAA